MPGQQLETARFFTPRIKYTNIMAIMAIMVMYYYVQYFIPCFVKSYPQGHSFNLIFTGHFFMFNQSHPKNTLIQYEPSLDLT